MKIRIETFSTVPPTPHLRFAQSQGEATKAD